jgi:superfamily II DNA/RNA helicase
VEDILKRKREWKAKMDNVENGESGDQIIDPGYDYARAVVLVPNKELAHQAVRMAASICGGLDKCVIWGAEALGIDHNRFPSEGDIPKEEDIVRLAILPGGLNAPKDFPPFRFATSSSSSHQRQPPPDLVFTTPANLGPMALSPKHIDFFADVSTLVVDEADMLLDGGYIRQLNNVLMGFRRADRLLDKYDSISFHHKSDDNNDDQSDSIEDEDMERKEQKKTQHVFVAATLPDYGLRSVDAYLKRKFPDAVNVTMAGMHNARHYGLEDESITVWNEIEDNQERMQRLVDVLRLDRSEVGVDGRGLKGEKVMVFLNTVNDVDGASNALRRAGIDAVPYHAKLGLEDRTSNLDKFRLYHAPSDGNGDDTNNNGKNTVPVLVCTDVASRGLDIPGVTAIIQLQFAQNVVAHLHRMGRCGRAGNQDGRGIVFYGSKQRELVEVVREAEEQQSRMTLIQDVEDELDDCGLESDGKSAKTEIGKVEKAFSRKRGFTKKRKKQRKRAREVTEG